MGLRVLVYNENGEEIEAELVRVDPIRPPEPPTSRALYSAVESLVFIVGAATIGYFVGGYLDKKLRRA